MRQFLLAAAATALLALPAHAQTPPDQTLRIALNEDADLLDPTLARTYVGRIVFAGLCDKLVDVNEKLEIVPQLATSWQWADNRTLVMKLRPGVTFHDGTPMDAAAVAYSLMRHLTMPGSSRRGEISVLDRAEVVDPATVRLVLKEPSAPFLSQLADRAGMIVSPKAAEAAGKDFGTHPVCAGPFSFTERVAQDRIVLDRFPAYWDAGNIHFARVVYLPIVNSTAKLANLQSGTVDLAERIQPTDADAVRADPHLRLMIYPWLGYQSINFNVAHGARANTPLGRDARVRKAFELAIDRTALVQVVYNGVQTPIAQAVPPASPFYDADVKPPARDLAAARKLLAEAGVSLPVPVVLTVANGPDTRQTGEVIQAMAAEAGFDVKVQQMEFASGLDAADRGDFEAYLIGWSGRPDADGNLWNFLHTGGPLNYPAYSNKDMDGWLDGARATTDLAARKALYAKVAVLTEQDLPILFLYSPQLVMGMSTKVSGFVPVPDGLIRLPGLKLAK
jgi:peptide/nickel transport system substrate-binding protein